jgi:hypothetical protein
MPAPATTTAPSLSIVLTLPTWRRGVAFCFVAQAALSAALLLSADTNGVATTRSRLPRCCLRTF